jgi:hypothetical protein
MQTRSIGSHLRDSHKKFCMIPVQLHFNFVQLLAFSARRFAAGSTHP